jgi:hypothetical protein
MEVQFFSLALKNNWGVLPFDSAAGALAVQAFPGMVRLLSFYNIMVSYGNSKLPGSTADFSAVRDCLVAGRSY